jgi:fumarate hydratase subunit alpha
MSLAERIRDALKTAAVELDEDVLERIKWARGAEEAQGKGTVASKASIAVLDAILENLEYARHLKLPMCQDTGLFLVFVDVGKKSTLPLATIEEAIYTGCRDAVEEAYYRRSVVEEPVFDRINTKTNLPPAIYWDLVDGSDVTIRILLKGFGSENCSSVRMLNPTGGSEAIIEAVGQIIALAGGKPCPPTFIGVGLGGTMDRAAYLSKRALFRDVRVGHAQKRYRDLEDRILAHLQTLGVGSGGMGGAITALSVAIEMEPTHIAGLPLAVSVNCWADRKATIIHKEGEDA